LIKSAVKYHSTKTRGQISARD